jgi:hypothetical protein
VAHCESNGLFYEPSTNRYLYSFYTNNSLVEVDRSSGESAWWAGAVAAATRSSRELAVRLATRCLVHVGGHAPALDQVSGERDQPHDLRARIRGPSRERHAGPGLACDSEAYASTNGDAWRLPNGNTLHIIGAAGQIKEYTHDCSVVWHLDFGNDYLLGRGEFVEDLYSLVSPIGKGMAP